MAQRIECGKFLIIECTAKELMDATAQPVIWCDQCGNLATPYTRKGCYVAVLNQWMCGKCFKKWKEDAVYHPEDAYIERKHFDFYAPLLGVKRQ